tara:strand:- start:718 stop:951 length:234 start_codon:yes stop_codon:yes gene_type:complete
MSKIDTQGLSGPTIEGCTDNVYPRDENGEPIYPPFNPTPLPLLEPNLRQELKDLINEVLDERERSNHSTYRLDELQE